jgi:hypothetical protein
MINIGQLTKMGVTHIAKAIVIHSTPPQSAPPFLASDGKRMEQGLLYIDL